MWQLLEMICFHNNDLKNFDTMNIGANRMKKFLKFWVIGILNTLITIGSFMLLVYLGMNYIFANIIGYGIGVINSFYWNKHWVFQVKSNHKNIFLKFVVVNLITLSLNTLSLYVFV